MHDPASLNPDVAARLRRLRARKRWRDAALFGARGLFYGSLVACAVAAAGAAADAEWLRSSPALPALLVPAAAVLAALAGALRAADDLRLARAVDRAAGSEDRFASAFALSAHPKRERVRLVTEDALARVGTVSAGGALPLRAPRELAWAPLPLAALVGLLWWASLPGAGASEPPEVNPDEWKALEQEVRRHLDEKLAAPRTPEEKEMAEKLRRLADLLGRSPGKKEALAELARLRAEWEKRRAGLKGHDVSLRRAARALQSSPALQPLAQRLARGDAAKSAQALRDLARQLAERKAAWTAEDLEKAAADLARLGESLSSHRTLGHLCEKCAAAAAALNPDRLAEALKELASELDKNADDLEESERLCEACDKLSDLERKLAERKDCKKCGGRHSGG